MPWKGKRQGNLRQEIKVNKKKKAKGPRSDSQALRTRSIDEIFGVEALDFGLGIGKILTPKSSIQQLQHQSEIRNTFNEWLQ